ncbi:MAG TPA: hypothetical protein VF503_30805 [Sphingobium sp.]|uniref:hypothetical protein n=1 Tax=Sphingobium sp. TaxID=1912891 RepID=UPI002ED3A98F
MTEKIPDPLPDPRKERLAAQLRANLRRRKAQGREMASGAGDDTGEEPAGS